MREQFMSLNFKEEYDEESWRNFKAYEDKVKDTIKSTISSFNDKYEEDIFSMGKPVTFEHSIEDNEYTIWFTIKYANPSIKNTDKLNEDRFEILYNIQESILNYIQEFNYDKRVIEGW